VLSLLFGLPHLLMWQHLHAEGRPYLPLQVDHVTALTWDETTYYAPRIQEVFYGHPFTVDPCGWEYKQFPAFMGVGVLPALLLSPLAFLLHGDANAILIASSFLLPPLLLLALLALTRRLQVPFWVGLAGSLVLLIAQDQIVTPLLLLTRPSWPLLVDRLHLLAAYRPLEFSRFFVPEFAYLFLLLTLVGLVETLQRPRLLTGVATSLALGALFYTYVFFWTYLLAAAALWLVLLLLERRRAAARVLLLVVAGGVLLGLPVVVQLVASHGYVGKAVLEARQQWGGKEVLWHNRWPELVLLAIFLLLLPWRDRRASFLASFAIAPLLCIRGVQFLGLAVQDWHWLARCWLPWMSLALPVALYLRLTEPCRRSLWARWRPWLARHALTPFMVAISVLTLAYGFNDHVRFSQTMADWYSFTPAQQQAYAWLRQNTAPDSVVAAADCNVLALVPVYSHCNVYLPFCLVTPAPDQELMWRFWTTARLLDLGPEAIERFLAPEEWTPEGFWYPHRWWMVNWLFHTQFLRLTLPPAVRAQVDQVGAQVAQTPVSDLLPRYRLDYLWVDDTIRSYCRTSPDQQPYLRRVFTSGDISLYRVLQPQGPGLSTYR
jgi:hypothetical protein